MRVPTLLALLLSSAALIPAHAADAWKLAGVDNFYMHTPTPNSFTGLYRSQGMATDGTQWFFSWQYGLERADNNFNSVQRNSSFTLPGNLSPGIPGALMAQGLNHIGDIDYHNGVIYASLDSTAGYTKPHVALFNASDLSYTGKVYELGGTPANPNKDLASWVAVDAKRGVGYGKEWQNGNTINVYNLDDWSFSHTITLDTPLARIQGAKVVGDWLYMASDNANAIDLPQQPAERRGGGSCAPAPAYGRTGDGRHRPARQRRRHAGTCMWSRWSTRTAAASR